MWSKWSWLGPDPPRCSWLPCFWHMVRALTTPPWTKGKPKLYIPLGACISFHHTAYCSDGSWCRAILYSPQLSTGPGAAPILSFLIHSIWCCQATALTRAFWQPPTSPSWTTVTHHRKGKEALLTWSSKHQFELGSSVCDWTVFN